MLLITSYQNNKNRFLRKVRKFQTSRGQTIFNVFFSGRLGWFWKSSTIKLLGTHLCFYHRESLWSWNSHPYGQPNQKKLLEDEVQENIKIFNLNFKKILKIKKNFKILKKAWKKKAIIFHQLSIFYQLSHKNATFFIKNLKFQENFTILANYIIASPSFFHNFFSYRNKFFFLIEVCFLWIWNFLQKFSN